MSLKALPSEPNTTDRDVVQVSVSLHGTNRTWKKCLIIFLLSFSVFLGAKRRGVVGRIIFGFIVFLMFLCGFLDAFFVSVEHCDLFII